MSKKSVDLVNISSRYSAADYALIYIYKGHVNKLNIIKYELYCIALLYNNNIKFLINSNPIFKYRNVFMSKPAKLLRSAKPI